MSECEQIRITVRSFLDEGSEQKPATLDVEVAAGHMAHCKSCRQEMAPDERGRFISSFVLERK